MPIAVLAARREVVQFPYRIALRGLRMRKLALLAGVSALAVMAFAQGDHVPAYNTAPPKAGEVMPILPARPAGRRDVQVSISGACL